MILPGCNLIPHNGMPIYVFEDCYREMLEESLSTHRMFFVAESVAESDSGIHTGKAGVFASPFAAAGMVRACLRNEDGSSHLFLQGLKRVRILEIDPQVTYPVATVCPVDTSIRNEEANQEMRRKIEIRIKKWNGVGRAEVSILLEGLQGAGELEVWADMAGARLLRSGKDQRNFLCLESLDDRLEFLWSLVDRFDGV